MLSDKPIRGTGRVHLPSPATVISLIALFVAMGGTTYAAVNLPANTVGTKQIKNDAVTGRKLANQAVTSAKVKVGSLLAEDFKLGQLPAGLQGPQGPKGDAGPQGPPGLSTGRAGGDLTGSYPNPSIAPGAVTPTKLGTIPQVSATNSADQSITTNSGGTEISLDTTEFDTDGMHSTAAGNNWYLTAPIAGVYEVNLSGSWSNNITTGDRSLYFDADGRIFASEVQAAPDITMQSVSALVKLNAGDQVYAYAWQDSGSTLQLGGYPGSDLGPHTDFSMTWIGAG